MTYFENKLSRLPKFVWILFTLYFVNVYMQGIYHLFDSNMNDISGILRDPTLPMWIKSSDEVMYLINFLYLFIFYLPLKIIIKNRFSIYIGLALGFFLFILGLKNYFLPDLLGVSVTKTIFLMLISFYLIRYINLKPDLSKKILLMLCRVVAASLFVGLAIYFVFPYRVYDNRLIGLILNPNFNSLHAFFVLIFFFDKDLSKFERNVYGLIGVVTIFFSCSFTMFLLLFIQIFVLISLSTITSLIKFRDLIKSLITLLFFFIFGIVLALVLRPNLIYTDYLNKYYAIAVKFNFIDDKEIIEFVKSKDLSNVTDRVASARAFLSTSDSLIIRGVKQAQSGYLQIDSSWLNIFTNFGLFGVGLVLGCFGFFYYLIFKDKKNSFNLKIPSNSNNVGLVVFSIIALVVGCIFQQYIEYWNTLILIVFTVGHLYYCSQEKTSEVSD